MSPAKRKQIDPLEKSIEAALSPGRFISYNAAWSFVEDVQEVASDIGKLVRKEPTRAARPRNGTGSRPSVMGIVKAINVEL